MKAQIKKILRPLYRPLVDWYRKPKRYRYLFEYIRQVKPKNILEIGTWTGKRAVQMIELAQKFTDEKSNVHYYGMDLFENLTDEQLKKEVSKRPPNKEKVERLLKETDAQVTLIQGNTTELPKDIWDGLPKMDFVFIDGGHRIETVKSDWKNVEGLMHNNSVVIFDDYWRNRVDAGAKPVVDAIDGDQFKVKTLPIVDIFDTEWGRLEIQFALVVKK